MEWNNLDQNIRNSNSLNILRNSIFKFVRPSANSVFNMYNSKGIKFIARLRLPLSHLREQKFKHSFRDLINPICNFGLNIELISHYRIHCPTYNTERPLQSTLRNIDNNLYTRGVKHHEG